MTSKQPSKKSKAPAPESKAADDRVALRFWERPEFWRLGIRLAVVLGVLMLGWLLRAITVPLMAAYMLMLVLRPWQQRLSRKVGDSFAALVCVAAVLAGPLLLLIPSLFEVGQLQELLPSKAETDRFAQQIQQNFNAALEKLPADVATSLESEPIDWKEQVTKALGWLAGIADSIAEFLGGMLGIATGLMLLPIFLFFLLKDGPWLPRVRAEMPPEWRERFDPLLRQIREILRVFCTSRLLVATGKGMLYFGILLLSGIPAPYTLALLAGGLSLLPVLGPAVALIGLAVIAFASQGLGGLAWAAVAYVLAELVEGYVLLPKLVGRGLGMSDFAVILAVLCGGALFGIFGLMIAIPTVAVARVLYDEFLRPVMGTEAAGEKLREAAEG